MFNNSSLETTYFPTQEMSSLMYLTAGILFGIIGFLGFALNLVVALVIVKESRIRWNPANVLHLNLVIGDLLVAIFGNPMAMSSAIAGGWYWGYEVCLWYAWFTSTLSYASIGSLTVMAVGRWLLVTRPTWIFSLRHAKLLVSSVWIYAFSLSLPPLLGWGRYGPQTGSVSCGVSWQIQDPITNNGTYIAFIFAVNLVIPLLIIVTSYTSILLTLMKNKARTGARRRRDVKVTVMAVLMIAAFLISWAPYAILALGIQFFSFRPSPWIAVLPTILANSSICFNPIIYAGLTTQFTCSLKKLFSRDNSSAILKEQCQGIALIRLTRSSRDVNVQSTPRGPQGGFVSRTL